MNIPGAEVNGAKAGGINGGEQNMGIGERTSMRAQTEKDSGNLLKSFSFNML